MKAHLESKKYPQAMHTVQCGFDQIPIHLYCNKEPPATLFDDVLLICNYEDNVDCGDRPIIDGTTTTTGTTTYTTSYTHTTTSGTTITTTGTTTINTGTTTAAATTTSAGQHIQRFPEKVMGFYIILADDTWEGFEGNSTWEPEMYEYMAEAANVLFFSFINPETMIVPNAYKKLMATKGSGASGTIPADTGKQIVVPNLNKLSLFDSIYTYLFFSCTLFNWRYWLQPADQPMALVGVQVRGRKHGRESGHVGTSIWH